MPNQKKGNPMYLKRIITMFLIIVIFFMFSFVTNLVLISDLQKLNEIFYFTSAGLANYSLTYNILREKIVYPDIEILNSKADSIFNATLYNSMNINNQIIKVMSYFVKFITLLMTNLNRPMNQIAIYSLLTILLYLIKFINLIFAQTKQIYLSNLIENCTNKVNSISKFVIILL